MKKCLMFFVLLLIHNNNIQSQELNADESLSKLIEGNERFVSSQIMTKDYKQEIKETSNSQHPYAIILTCADSRVTPEIIFDESIGKLFVVRVAGNILTPEVLGSIEYAAEHLHSNLLLILGHEKCGAVSAAFSDDDFPDYINSLIVKIKPIVEKVKSENKDGDLLHIAVEENVKSQVEESTHFSKILHELFEEGKIKIIGGIYDISTGVVRFF